MLDKARGETDQTYAVRVGVHDKEKRTVWGDSQRTRVALLDPQDRPGQVRLPLPCATGEGARNNCDPGATATHGFTAPPSLNTFTSLAIDQGVSEKVIEL